MDNLLRKGRTLHLDGIANAPVKVTLGFKCEGREKIALANEAHNSSMTLSEYVEYVVSLRHEQRKAVIAIPTLTNSELEKAHQMLRQLQQRLDFYEKNGKIQSLLAAYKGQINKSKDADGNEQTVVVNHETDIFQIMINSFKTN